MDAQTFLEVAGQAMGDRAASRDTPQERSMKATVDAFNALYGTNLTETQGWGFMVLLKLVRGNQGKYRADDHIDAVAYAALQGEAAHKAQAEETEKAFAQSHQS